MLGKEDVQCKGYEQIDEWLSVKELAQRVDVSAGRIRQITSEIPGGQLTELGWRFPQSAIEYVINRPDGQSVSKKRKG